MADVLYTEPSWRAGYVTFLERAGNADFAESDYNNYLAGLARQAVEFPNGPAYMVVGKSMLRRLSPDWSTPTLLNDGGAFVAGWRCDPVSFSNSRALVADLVSRFQCVYDPCCGYGNACLAFHRSQKRFVACDINTKCLSALERLVRDA